MPNSHAYLTGNWRFRLNWRGNAILQVEVKTGLDADYSTIVGSEEYHTDWRDAKQGEIYYLQSAGYFSPGTGFKGLKI